MSTAQNKSPVEELQQSDSKTCKALLTTATPEMFRANAFRITGLPVDATTREITRHADKLKMMEELGQGKSAHTGAFALTPAPSLDQIRNAIQCLRDPERRLLDEFFWFWPDDFGNSANDPAIQALAGGDRETALEIWTLKETSPTAGLTAMHNVAVLWQLVALEWEEYAGHEQVDDERRSKIQGYWRNAFKRWHLLAVDDFLWERVCARVKQLDEPRLTAGFVRKIRATLPQALDKINAELAVRYAESGRMDLARVHVQFIRETSQGLVTLNKTIELVLAPNNARLKQQFERAQKRAKEKPADAGNAARELLKHASSSLTLFELFYGKNSEAGNELAENVATLSNRLQVAYHDETEDHNGCLNILDIALPYATTRELRQLIENNICQLKGFIARERLEPVLGILQAIDESPASPKTKLARVNREVIPTLANLIRQEGASSNTAHELSDSIARSLRGISIDAYNEHDDIDTAFEAIGTALDLAQESDLRKRLEADKAQLTRNKSEEKKHNLLLEIRNDKVEVTRERFRFNSHVIPAKSIDGVRFGIFTKYTNGMKSSVSYTVGVRSAGHGDAHLECKRIFRDEEKAASDFQAIVSALHWQVIPALCSRLATSIVAGANVALGDCKLTHQGILATTGVLLWKEEHLIPWSDVRFGNSAGYLKISSAKIPKIQKLFALRDIWNAVIFRELFEAVVSLHGKKRKS